MLINCRKKCSRHTKDQRHDKNVSDNQILIPIPTPTTIIPDPINVNNKVSIEEEDLTFLNEFTHEIPSSRTDISKIATEGEFTI